MPLFEATRNTPGERSKADYKNWNIKILQHMYHGDSRTSLHCLATGSPGWEAYPCVISNELKHRFQIHFNHIRQKKHPWQTAPGISVDKSKAPSAIFRQGWWGSDIVEFMTMMPLSIPYHKHVTQSSYFGHITLENFPKENWPWILQSAKNFNAFCREHKINIGYKQFIDHLRDIEAPAIRDRIKGHLAPEWTG